VEDLPAPQHLKRIGHQHSAFGANRCLSVFTSNSTTQFDDVSTEAHIPCDLDDQPFEPDCLIGEYRTAKFDPILETDH